jgi:hypothetical protein
LSRVVIGKVLRPAAVFDEIKLIIARSKSTSLHFSGNASAFGRNPVSNNKRKVGADNLERLTAAVVPRLK